MPSFLPEIMHGRLLPPCPPSQHNSLETARAILWRECTACSYRFLPGTRVHLWLALAMSKALRVDLALKRKAKAQQLDHMAKLLQPSPHPNTWRRRVGVEASIYTISMTPV